MPLGTIVNIGLSGLLALFVLGGVIFGVIRGLKKSGLRLATIVVTIILAFVLTTVIANAVAKIDISFLNIKIGGHTVTTVTNGIELYLKQMTAGRDVDVASLANLAVALSMMVINTVVFPILFLVLRYLLLPLYWILAKVLFGRQRKVEEERVESVKSEENAEGEETEQVEEIKFEKPKPVKPKKHRALGALVGGVSGLLISSVVFTPVVGYMSTAQIVEEATVSESGKGIIGTMVGAQYNEVVDAYNGSAYYYISKYSGTQALSNWMFDSVAVSKINGKTIKINREIKVLAQSYKEVQDIVTGLGIGKGGTGIQNLTKADLNKYLASVQKLINLMYSSDLVVTVGDVVMPIGIAYVRGRDLSGMGDEYMRSLIEASLDVAQDYSFKDARQVANSMLNVTKLLNDHDILLPLMQGKVNKVEDISGKITKQFAHDVMTELFDIDLVSNVAVEATNMALHYLTKMLDVEYVEPTGVDKDATITALTNLAESFGDALSGINTNSWMYYNESDVAKIGSVLEAIRTNPVIAPTYNNIINKLEDKVRSAIDNISVGTAVKDDLKLAVDKLSDVSDWITEFGTLQSVVREVNLAVTSDGLKLKEGGFETYDFSHLGAALDGLNETTMFDQEIGGVQFTRRLVTDAIEWLQDEKLGENGAKLTNSINAIKNNVLSITSWENALGGAQDLVLVIKDLANKDVVEEFKDPTSTLVTDLGDALNTAQGTPLFANNAVKTFVKDLLGIVEDSVASGTGDMATLVQDLITDMKNNVDSASTINWKQSLLGVQDLVVVAQDLTGSTDIIDEFKDSTSTLATDLGKALDKAATTVFFANNTVDNFVKDLLDIVQDKVATAGNATMITHAINEMKDNIDAASTIKWEDEFGDFRDLFASDLDNVEIETMSTLATTIDTIIARNHAIIRNNVINAMLDSVVDSALDGYSDAKYTTAINNIKSRIATLTGAVYSNEVEYVNTLMDLLDNPTLSGIDIESTSGMSTLGTAFESVRSSHLVGDTGNDIIDYVLTDYVNNHSGDEYIGVLNAVKTNFTNQRTGVTISGYYTNLFSNLSQAVNIGDDVPSVDIDNVNTAANSIETMLDAKRTNPLISYNGASEIAIVAMGKVKDVIADKRTEINNNTSLPSETKDQILEILDEAKNRADGYIADFGAISADTYVYSTDRPFTDVADMILEAKTLES